MPAVRQPLPEFLERQDVAPRTWSILEGAPVRGDAWTEMRAARMRVPFGDDALSRVVRAHEMMHAKVSPVNGEALNAIKIDHACLISAEEFRVNMLIAHQGFDVSSLADGSESRTGRILGENNDWNGIVRFIASVAGTKSCADFLRGLKASNPEYAKQARAIQNHLMKEWRRATKYGTKHIASTADKGGLPGGFAYSVNWGRFLESLLHSENTDGTPDEFDNDEAPDVANIAKGKSGKFAQLIELTVAKPRNVDGRMGRKRIATNIGKNPRRIHRMLVDPEQRVFDKRARGKGGVVLIDQSGSMSLSDNDIWSIIEHAPGCVIIGYSHLPGSTDVPNIWVIAERGNVAETAPKGNGGNGVDGPALRFALAKRRHNEPFIWVCDGGVTDGANDSYYENLAVECVDLVAKNGIHMVEDVHEAVSALKLVARGTRLPTVGIGPLRNMVKVRTQES